ncbi:MAG: energy-coupling factor ABC transporter ATP-binding protein [Actinobacteria bacterium]|nr:energy-coupling factor ABC transporter ATP-binding protein [Thermoleophilia bacterium]MCB0971768.1 energy-coupling factor ABC transporter ATP-binding protein [Acidimicrobiales bacterium]MCB9010303.1 energy-coupling factor ABC transporter ATP-binding protein [Actinomycetota bacterium]
MIEVDRVTVRTPEGRALLQEVSLTIEPGRTAIIGANGSGKTTLVRLLNGLATPSEGAVSVDGRDTVSARRDVQRRVGFVFQQADHQLVSPTPAEDVALGLRARGIRRREAMEHAAAALARFDLAHVADQAIHTLSGGEKHLVAMAGVLALKPDWMVLDEPTTSLDLVNRRRVLAALGAVDQHLVVVSHDLDLVREMDRAVLVDSGRVRCVGDPAEVIGTYLALMEGR